MRAEAAARDAVRGRAAGAATAAAAAAVAVPRARRRSPRARGAAARLLFAILGIVPVGEALVFGRVRRAPVRRRVAATRKRRSADENERDACRRFARAVRHGAPS